MTKPSSNCLICGKPTYEKPSKNGDVLCSQQCIFIFSNRNSIKVKYEKVSNEILELRKDNIEFEDQIAELQGKVDALIMFKTESIKTNNNEIQELKNDMADLLKIVNDNIFNVNLFKGK